MLFTWLIYDICGNVAEDMFTYELKELHQPSGKEMALQVLNLPSVEPMLRVVRDDLLNQGITHDDISLYIPPLFYAQLFVVPILDYPVPGKCSEWSKWTIAMKFSHKICISSLVSTHVSVG